MSERLEVVLDPVADALDEMADLAEVWKRQRERGRMPSGVRMAMLCVAREAVAYVDAASKRLPA